MNGVIDALRGEKSAVLQLKPVGELPCKSVADERLAGLRRARHSSREVDRGANHVEGRPGHAADNRFSGGEPDMRLKPAARRLRQRRHAILNGKGRARGVGYVFISGDGNPERRIRP